MHLQFSSDGGENEGLREFARWTLDIGDGKLGVLNDGEALVEIPPDLLVTGSGNYLADIVEATYPDILNGMRDSTFFQQRAILAPTLEIVERVNNFVMDFVTPRFPNIKISQNNNQSFTT